MASPNYLLHYWMRLQQNHYDISLLNSGNKGCLTKDTLIDIPTNTGSIKKTPLHKLIGLTNFDVCSYNIYTGKIEIKNAAGCCFVKYDDVFRIELSDGRTIKATANHPFLLTTGKYKELKDLVWGKKSNQSDRLQTTTGPGIIKQIIYIGKKDVYDIFNVPDNHNFIANGIIVSNSGKSSASIYLAMKYLEYFSFICPKCGNRFYKNLYSRVVENNVTVFKMPPYIKDNRAWIKCPLLYKLDAKTGDKVVESGCGYEFKYSQRRRIKWDPRVFVAYDNKDVVDKLYKSPQHSPIIIDEAMNVIASQNHNRIENKYLKQLLTVVRPRRYILFFNIPEAQWVDSKVREGMSSFWLRMIDRGVGVLLEKDKGEALDKYHTKELAEVMGVVKYFTNMQRIQKKLEKHPCYFDTFHFPELNEKIYDEYELVRNAVNIQRQVEEMQLSNKDLAKIISYNIINNFDRLKIAVDKSPQNKLSYSTYVEEALTDPLTRKRLVSEMTVRNWVKGVEDYIKTKGKDATAFEGNTTREEIEL